MREKKEVNILLGEQVRRAREHQSLTQEKLAELIGVSVQYVSDLERGIVGISISTLKRLCVALCVSSDQLLFGSQEGSDRYVFAEKCSVLSPRQFAIVNEIIDKFIEAVMDAQAQQ